GDVREVAVRGALRGQDVDRLEPGGPQGGGDVGRADAVHWRVDDREAAGLADRLGDDGRDVVVVHLPADPGNRAVFDPAGEGLLRDLAVGGRLDASDDARVVGRDHLAAGRGVALEAVVRRRVVRGGDHDAGVAGQVAHREREQRGRPGLGEQED